MGGRKYAQIMKDRRDRVRAEVDRQMAARGIAKQGPFHDTWPPTNELTEEFLDAIMPLEDK